MTRTSTEGADHGDTPTAFATRTRNERRLSMSTPLTMYAHLVTGRGVDQIQSHHTTTENHAGLSCTTHMLNAWTRKRRLSTRKEGSTQLGAASTDAP